uniref:Uncharacterized protein n=1 Tax=Triticum urartu TaxID=4572 RepID=A0A8R7PNR9_TRIUA
MNHMKRQAGQYNLYIAIYAMIWCNGIALCGGAQEQYTWSSTEANELKGTF